MLDLLTLQGVLKKKVIFILSIKRYVELLQKKSLDFKGKKQKR